MLVLAGPLAAPEVAGSERNSPVVSTSASVSTPSSTWRARSGTEQHQHRGQHRLPGQQL